MLLKILILMSFATEFLIKSPEANPHEYLVFQQNSDLEKISNHFLQCKESLWLKQQVKKAQYQFLNGSLQESQILFQQIADKKWSCDWNEEERKTISFSLLRLAELTQDKNKATQLLTTALEFDPEVEPDQNVFPPPLLEDLKRIKANSPLTKILIPSSLQKWNHILRNGKFISLSGLALEIHPGRALYTFVSESYVVEHRVMSAQELLNFQLEPQPLVQGDCQDFRLHESVQSLTNTKVFFTMDCQKEVTNNLQVALSIPSLQGLPELPAPAQKNWVQRNFLWIGLTAVGTLLIVNQISKKNQEPNTIIVPTTTANR